jgi:steroid 5-alpha reductase family enzyme
MISYPEFFTALLSIFILVNTLFIISLVIKRNDIADIFWGPGIFLSSLALYVSNIEIHQNKNSVLIVTLSLIFLWALRIFLHIGSRFLKKKEEDFRYKNWRNTWKYFYIRSYFQIYIFQGFLMFLMSLAVLSVISQPPNGAFPLAPFYSYVKIFVVGVGISLSLFGLLFEAIADLQLKQFLTSSSQQPSGTQIMKSGVWKYSRHPNYFGEITFWFGILLISLPQTLSFSLLLSCIPFTLISFLLLKVSGIPLLEEKYKDNQEFLAYKEKTPALVPNFFIR